MSLNVWPSSGFFLDRKPTAGAKSFPNDKQITNSNYTTHVASGVEELHKRGAFGKGAVIALLDEGVDYNHPAASSSPRNNNNLGHLNPNHLYTFSWEVVSGQDIKLWEAMTSLVTEVNVVREVVSRHSSDVVRPAMGWPKTAR